MSQDPTALFRLDGKVALVTGGSRGLGREMILAYSRMGADVVISSRKQDACEALAKEVENETGQRALAIGAHVGEWDQCDALAARALDHFGKVDVLVNNAGMSPLYGDITEVTEALWDKVLGVNLKGAFRLMSVLGGAMRDGDGGSIIGISSTAAEQPSPRAMRCSRVRKYVSAFDSRGCSKRSCLVRSSRFFSSASYCLRKRFGPRAQTNVT